MIKSLIVTAATLSALSLASATPAFACSCGSLADGFFATVAAHNDLVKNGTWPQSHALTVVTGKIVEHKQLRPGPHPTEMIVEVDNLLQGTIHQSLPQLPANQIVVEGDNGMQCRPYVTQFPVGTTWVLAVSQATDEQGHYAISVCGDYAAPTTQPGTN